MPIVLSMDGVSLPPELEQFAADAIAAGHYRDTADVVRAGVELLKRHGQARAALLASVLAAKAEGDRDGYLTGDEVAAHVGGSIARKSGALT
jgi:putative addiction module CopG family antidote